METGPERDKAKAHAMHETSTLHFGLGHRAPDQPFTLHVGSRSYPLTPHTRQALALARRSDKKIEVANNGTVFRRKLL